jgi:hypothetical protein
METARAKPVALPAPDCDLLTGIEQVAQWYGITEGQVRARIAHGEIVVFKIAGRNTIYALKSDQNDLWKKQAETYRAI